LAKFEEKENLKMPEIQNKKDRQSESENQNTDQIPVPPDVQRDQIPVEEPPEVKEQAPIDEDIEDNIERIA
jgi:hypothetical protein